jgi:hypothetical protein
MKTIMKELVDIMNADQVSFTEWFQDNYQMLIEKEKQRMFHCFNAGADAVSERRFNEWFNKTYNQSK